LIGGIFAVVGFFVVPVVGLIIGVVVGVYASERQRVGARSAWTSTKAVLRAMGVWTRADVCPAATAL
jgi:hypothetical protein